MLSCSRVEALLLESPLSDLPAPVAQAVRAHCAVCASCDDFVAAYDAVAPMVRSALEVEIDAELQAQLDAAVMAAIRETG